METWELVARERIRDTLAQYTWSGDAFRLEEMVEAFCPDGTLEVRGQPPYVGRDAIIAFLGGGAGGDDDERRRARLAEAEAAGVRRIVRHTVANLRFVELTPDQASVATYFTVVTEIGLDHCGRYRDTLVPVGDRWLLQHRFVSTDWRAPDSVMAAPSAVS